MNPTLQRVALRYGGLYLPGSRKKEITPDAAALLMVLNDHGYSLTEDALHAIDALSHDECAELAEVIENVYGTRLNWASLTRDWTVPTGTTWADHCEACLANLLPDGTVEGVRLQCGHLIPDGLFDLSRYNGCPICGTPFVTAEGAHLGQRKPSKVLRAMGDADMLALLTTIVAAPVPPDATALATLRDLVGVYGVPDGLSIGTIEATIAIAATLFGTGDPDAALAMLSTPQELLRMLWYVNVGDLRIRRPHEWTSAYALHYSRSECAAVARRLDAMVSDIDAACAAMHPLREVWVRFIRALRLPEYARRKHLGTLAALLDRFYRGDYPVWAGTIEEARLAGDHAKVLAMLSERPGVFARSLFATMLHAGVAATLAAFARVAYTLPPRLLYSLASFADDYFMPEGKNRTVVLADGRRVAVPVNPMLGHFTDDERAEMVLEVKSLVLAALRGLYSPRKRVADTVYIAPELFETPLPVGDRATAVQDTSSALPGQRFKVLGDKVRLFLQWGEGLPAQHLDMDLSAKLLYADGEVESCAYFNLSPRGAVHSGDIQQIPDLVGTAEYIELDLPALAESKVEYVVFACNAYSCDKLSPNLKVGWMSCDAPMKVDNDTGVAYDPSTVDHIERIGTANAARGLVFGVLDVAKAEITWLDMPNGTQRIDQFDSRIVSAYLRKLRSKISIGELLALYAEVTGSRRVDSPADAGAVFDTDWALNSAAAASLLL